MSWSVSPNNLLCISPCIDNVSPRIVVCLPMSCWISVYVFLCVWACVVECLPYLVVYFPISFCVSPMSFHASRFVLLYMSTLVSLYVCMPPHVLSCVSPFFCCSLCMYAFHVLLYVSQWLVVCIPVTCYMSPHVLWNVSSCLVECLDPIFCWMSRSYVLLSVLILCLVICLPMPCWMSPQFLLCVSPYLAVCLPSLVCLPMSCWMSLHILLHVPCLVLCLPTFSWMSPHVFLHIFPRFVEFVPSKCVPNFI